MELVECRRSGIDVLCAPSLEENWGIGILFTGRAGGFSGAPFASFNLSYGVGDESEKVRKNRALAGGALGVPPERWVMCGQVHGARVSKVGVLDTGRGGTDRLSALPRTDGLVTETVGLPVGVLTADCVPVVLAARGPGAVAVVHAGWRGVLSGVIERALSGIARKPGDLAAFLGPHIHECCMVVDDEIARRFVARIGGEEATSRSEGLCRLSLARAISNRLRAAGIPERMVHDAGVCTCCGEGHFSYRASEGITGRQAALAVLAQ